MGYDILTSIVFADGLILTTQVAVVAWFVAIVVFTSVQISLTLEVSMNTHVERCLAKLAVLWSLVW